MSKSIGVLRIMIEIYVLCNLQTLCFC